tara:strand:- start:2851 stop:3645 length:795 start_codon:yes stop_codon:yes gene_type:complete
MKLHDYNKELFYLIGLPRSGNTFFSSLMNQNPDLGVTANSICLEIFKDVFLLKQTDTFYNYPDHKSFDNVLSNIYKNYYQNWPQKYIIERGPALTPGNQMVIEKYLNQPIKCIILWRDLMDVIASFIKWFENEPTAFINKLGLKTVEEKVWKLMNTKGIIAKELIAIQNALTPENRSKCHIVRYNDLVTNPEKEIRQIYSYLKIPYFNHNYNHIEQFSLNNLGYNDSVVGNNLHTIKSQIKLEENPYKKMIPESIREAYGHIKI